MKSLLLLVLVLVSQSAIAANRNVLVTGFWPPTNGMLRSLSPSPVQNPKGWQGKNWKASGYDVYAYFPEFSSAKDGIGTGDFRVDFASTYNDFMKYTQELKPVAILSFGQGQGPWEIEGVLPALFTEMFRSGNIPSSVGVKVSGEIPESLKVPTGYLSTLPVEEIRKAVNGMSGGPMAWVDMTGGAGDYLCGFIGYLGAWYKKQHNDPRSPDYTAMSGFIHVSADAKKSEEAALATIDAVVSKLPK